MYVVWGDCAIGRGQSCGVVLPDFTVSRRHAVVRHEPHKQAFLLSDAGSTYGTGYLP
jgi:pSer/pThr/pTyr-binding forkhead associated (FHA) protein